MSLLYLSYILQLFLHSRIIIEIYQLFNRHKFYLNTEVAIPFTHLMHRDLKYHKCALIFINLLLIIFLEKNVLNEKLLNITCLSC